MNETLKRREFIQLSVGTGALCAAWPGLAALAADQPPAKIISPGCRKSKVKVARLFLGRPGAHWPHPKLNMDDEVAAYRKRFAELADELKDVEFVTDQLLTEPAQVEPLAEQIKQADGVLLIHINMGVVPILEAILKLGRPTMLYAAPYSGHEWTRFGAIQQSPLGARLCCVLTSDYRRLAQAIRPFRAIHHLRHAKILNVTARSFAAYAEEVRKKFGTEIKQIGIEQMLEECKAIDDQAAKAEADRWIKQAVAVVEPTPEEVFRSCKLALAFEKLMDQEEATVMTMDCYGSAFKPICQGFAFPCVGFVRLNDMGLGGICESDLRSAMTHIIMQGLTGRPGFISDPTVDESKNSIILAHCLGSRKMDGPAGPAAPYKLRTIMERQEGVVPQVTMRVGQKVTQAILATMDLMPYFTGEVIEVPDLERGCRTKINVRVDGDARTLWKNWSHGLHRVTCYGDIVEELQQFCRYMNIALVNEAVEQKPALPVQTATKT